MGCAGGGEVGGGRYGEGIDPFPVPDWGSSKRMMKLFLQQAPCSEHGTSNPSNHDRDTELLRYGFTLQLTLKKRLDEEFGMRSDGEAPPIRFPFPPTRTNETHAEAGARV
ncbi:unnamed protein product [Arctogadus glacialis]